VYRKGPCRTDNEQKSAGVRGKKAFRTTPDSCPHNRISPNRLDRHFIARAPNRRRFTDVKYVRTSAGWLYLVPVIDLFSRGVVGCAMSTEQDGKLSLEARGNPRNALVHLDRGGIYGRRRFR